jgi:hypothetical protein
VLRQQGVERGEILLGTLDYRFLERNVEQGTGISRRRGAGSHRLTPRRLARPLRADALASVRLFFLIQKNAKRGTAT